ncbi:MAG: hypothetical protein HY301_13940 [Verrucomicrobia bacterium]|nr:hypothetical protein [Verrucomicrobiota bacterium]
MKKLFLALTLLATLALIPARAALLNVGPFAGTLSEYWESFPTGFPNSPVPIMGGAATLTLASVNSDVIGTSGFSPNITGKSLGHLASGTPSTIAFSTPVIQFGAYWSTIIDGTAFVNFYDENNQLIGGTQVFATPNLSDVWQGWASSLAIKSLTFDFVNAQQRGGVLEIDGLQAVPVPELSTWLAGALLLGAMTWRGVREVRVRKVAMAPAARR